MVDRVKVVSDIAINYSEILLFISDIVPLRDVNFYLNPVDGCYDVVSEDSNFVPVIFFGKHVRAIYESLSALDLDASKYVKKIRFYNGRKWIIQHFFFVVKGSTKLESIHSNIRTRKHLNRLVRDYTLNYLKMG